MQAGPCISVGVQLEKAEVDPTSGPTWRLSHFADGLAPLVAAEADRALGGHERAARLVELEDL